MKGQSSAQELKLASVVSDKKGFCKYKGHEALQGDLARREHGAVFTGEERQQNVAGFCAGVE